MFHFYGGGREGDDKTNVADKGGKRRDGGSSRLLVDGREREFHRTIAITRVVFRLALLRSPARTCPLNYTTRSEPASHPNPSIARLALHFRLDYSPRHQSPRQSHKHPKPDSPVTINLESFLARVTAGFRESVSLPFSPVNSNS